MNVLSCNQDPNCIQMEDSDLSPSSKTSNSSLPKNITDYLSLFNTTSFLPGSKWPIVKKWVHSGLVTRDLLAKQQEVEERKLPFQFITPIGSTEPVINTEKLRQYYNSLKPEYLKVAEYLIEKLTIIDLKTFVELTKTNCKQLDAALKGEEYKVAMTDGKSQSWVANIACRFLSKLPISTCNIVDDIKDVPALFENSCKNIVRFDDGSYSGAQLEGFMQQVFSYCEDNYFKLKEPVNCYLVIGYVTHEARERLKTMIEKFHDRNSRLIFHIICNKEIKVLKNMFAEDGVDKDFKDKAMALLGPKAAYHNAVITTEWKRPDWMSTAVQFFSGLSDPKVFRDPEAPKIAFIPERIKPY